MSGRVPVDGGGNSFAAGDAPPESAFTLVELLVVIVIITIVAAMVIPSMIRARASANRTVCLNNLRQINLATHMYVEEQGDSISPTNAIHFSYKNSLQPYLGRSKSAPPQDRLFACPADDFDLDGPLGRWYTFNGYTNVGGKSFYKQGWTHFSSYSLNQSVRQGPGGSTNVSGLAQRSFNYVVAPHKTVLVGEISGATGLSAHDRKAPLQFTDPPSMTSFVDGHVDYIKMFWNGVSGSRGMPWFYEPPSEYAYKWTSN
jgi:prepilin-type N-terminal cleavage/methylation domain-containing protein